MEKVMLDYLKELEKREEDLNCTKGVSDNDYSWEFWKIQADSQDVRESSQFLSREAEKPVNASRNRYRDIIPYDHSRVVLTPGAGFSSISDYINASFINGAHGKVAYISAQGPLPETVEDFWRMVHQLNIRTVVMLTRLVEMGRRKCEQYWPESASADKTVGPLSVHLLEESRSRPEFCIRHLRLEERGAKKRCIKLVHHLQYLDWPDHGAPEQLQPLVEFLETLRNIQPDHNTPILIHCSAGCGRSGTICALDFVRSLVVSGKLGESKFSVADIVTSLRRQRPAMVQVLDQYILLHRAVGALFKQHLRMLADHDYENLPTPSALTPSILTKDDVEGPSDCEEAKTEGERVGVQRTGELVNGLEFSVDPIAPPRLKKAQRKSPQPPPSDACAVATTEENNSAVEMASTQC